MTSIDVSVGQTGLSQFSCKVPASHKSKELLITKKNTSNKSNDF